MRPIRYEISSHSLFRPASSALQFHNHMEVEYLPVVIPTAEEKANPTLLSERVQKACGR